MQLQSSLQVFKFGGTSVGSAEAVRLATGYVKDAAPRVVAVVSAMSGVTDLLLGTARSAARGDLPAALDGATQFHVRHIGLMEELFGRGRAPAQLVEFIDASTQELRALCQGLALVNELTPRTQDLVVSRGERVLARIFTRYLMDIGCTATLVEATDLIHTVRRSGDLWPDWDRCEEAARRWVTPLLHQGHVVVVPGFIGRGPQGEVVTLGRGGSDFSAAIMAHSVRADSVTLYKEVDGLMTADPRAVAAARVVPALHYREAGELAYYGARILHPRTMIPLMERNIPLYIRNTFNAACTGTRIAANVEAGRYPVKALTSVRNQALVSVEGNGMMGVPGIAGRTFSALSRAGHSVTMISQASSESSICLVLPMAEADDAVRALKTEFLPELEGGLIEDVTVEKELALIAVVGLGMRGTPGIAGRTFTTLSNQKVNIIAIAQGSSELNITMAIRDADVANALEALHAEYQLDRLRALPNAQGRETHLALLGMGQIGKALARQLLSQHAYFQDDLGLNLRCAAVADRSGVVIKEGGWNRDEFEALVERKKSAGRLQEGGQVVGLPAVTQAFAEKVWPLPMHKPIFVDLTAEETAPLLREALRRGFHVVLANKKPLAVPRAEYDELKRLARERRVWIRYEATVGAGLPVLDTLAKLEEAGDEILAVQGCLSGTLGYLMTQLEEGLPFSRAVKEAHARGYTEPDPREDLSGTDVARKALILARTLGRSLDLADVQVEPLFPQELSDPNPHTFIQNLARLDASLAERHASARRRNCVLRYVAMIDRSGVRVGLKEVPDGSSMGRLKGTDNQVVIQTRRYETNPLVVTGPGAGADVTAAGVLNDILAIASGRERHGGTVKMTTAVKATVA